MYNLYTRMRLTDGREGLLLGSIFRGPGDPEQLDILTDDYVKVICRHDQVKVIRRHGETSPLSPEPGGDKTKVYPVERDNIHRLREAVWHDHYQRCGVWEDGPYSDTWNSGDIKPLPEQDDIREKPEAFAQQLKLID